MAKPPSRKRARRDALFVLYQREVREEHIERLYEELREREGYPADPFTRTLVDGVVAHVTRLDATIGRLSRGWPVERLAPLERCVMRLALWEMESGDTPPEVAIDEAVRLTRTYSTDRASALVNGVLGEYLKQMRSSGEPDDRTDAGTEE